MRPINSNTSHYTHTNSISDWQTTDLSPKNTAQLLSTALQWTNNYATINGLPRIGIGSLAKTHFEVCNPDKILQIRLLSAGGGAKDIHTNVSLMRSANVLKSPEHLFEEFKQILAKSFPHSHA
ncbi:MAG: hypothetical protein O2897_03140 [bacterium]|nr:hypothetical protein [bacterium]